MTRGKSHSHHSARAVLRLCCAKIWHRKRVRRDCHVNFALCFLVHGFHGDLSYVIKTVGYIVAMQARK